MHASIARLITALAFLVLPLSTFGQLTTQHAESPLTVAATGCSEDRGDGQPHKQEPYTAEFKTTTVQTLANGVTITRESTETRAADSQGRWMNSNSQAGQMNGQPAFNWANVNDPVEGTQITWDTNSKHVRVIKFPPEGQRHGCWASDSGNMRMNYGPMTPSKTTVRAAGGVSPAIAQPAVMTPNIEDLGTETIQGIEARGQRSTMTIPAGQIGNDQPLVTVNESWTASSLGFEIRRISDDPQSGKSTMELVSIDQTDPPITTFQPPSGYEVTTEELHQVACPEQGKPWQ
jgi:hypothetical protein